MIRYVAFLRGINISGKNKVSMQELKDEFKNLNYFNVLTYINSGNIIFSSVMNSKELTKQIKEMIIVKFNLDIPVLVKTVDELNNYLDNAPTWWGNDNKEIYDNLILVIPPSTVDEVKQCIGSAKDTIEKIGSYKDVIYWSFNLKDYSKTNWIKTADSTINDKITMRTANTIKKIVHLSN